MKLDQWLDQPIIPLEEYAPVQDVCIYPVKNTVQLLNEFKQVYNSVEMTHLTSPADLTPPETPPHTPPQTPLQANLNDLKVYIPKMCIKMETFFIFICQIHSIHSF